jgi:hypothetical protein
MTDKVNLPTLTTDDLTSLDTYSLFTDYGINQISVANLSNCVNATGALNIGGTVNISQTYQHPFLSSNISIIDSIGNKAKVQLTEKGLDMDANCDVKIGDFSLKESLERIEKRLGIININPKLEAEWEELKELGERYRKLEQDIKDKLSVWNVLKNI